MSRRVHDHANEPRGRNAGTDALPLFEVVRHDAPSRPIAASERGADAVKAKRPNQYARILAVLATLPGAECLPYDVLAMRAEVSVNALCGRMYELCPVFVERVDDGATSLAGLTVTGYRITETGRARLERARRSA